MKELVIDPDLCAGHGRCYTLAPDAFQDDESGYGQVVKNIIVTDEDRKQAELAVKSCPEDAISIRG
jgi:ferredoxin